VALKTSHRGKEAETPGNLTKKGAEGKIEKRKRGKDSYHPTILCYRKKTNWGRGIAAQGLDEYKKGTRQKGPLLFSRPQGEKSPYRK